MASTAAPASPDLMQTHPPMLGRLPYEEWARQSADAPVARGLGAHGGSAWLAETRASLLERKSVEREEKLA